MKRVLLLLTVLLMLLAGLFASGCGKYAVQSERRTNDILIDGNDSDWPGKSVYYLEDMNVFLAVCNDDSFIYFMLKTGNTDIIPQVLERGFTVWLDPKGDNKKTFGVHFPIGMQNDKSSNMGTPPKNMENSGDQAKKQMPNPQGGSGRPDMPEMGKFDAERMKRMMGSIQKMEILISGKRTKQTIPADSSAICDLISRFDLTKDGFLIYELKVPIVLTSGRPYGIDCWKSGKFGMTLETGKTAAKKKMEMPTFRDASSGGMQGGDQGGISGGPGGMSGGPGGGMPGDGMSGGPGGMRGVPGGGPGGNKGGMPGHEKVAESFKFKAEVQLAVLPVGK